MKKFLSEKEILFCVNYHNCQNAKEAAIKTGYPAEKAEKIAQKLLSKKTIIKLIDEYKANFEKEKMLNLALTALKRMIFYRVNDAVELAICHDNFSKQEIAKLDLFQICELKKQKDGGFEFKFVDRLKAIETLLVVLEKTQNKTQINDFLKALTAKPAYENNDQF